MNSPEARPGCRALAVVLTILVAIVSSTQVVLATAQVSPEEHASHHPDQADPATPVAPDGDAATSGGMGGMGEMMKGGGHMTGDAGEPADYALYPTLMRLPDLPIEQRAEIESRAHGRMKAGISLLAGGLDDLIRATPTADFRAMQQSTDRMREGLAIFESGLAAHHALAEGQVPRNVALRWFKSEMDLLDERPGDSTEGVFGLSWFHFSMMLALVVFACAVSGMYFHKMKRASLLLERLAETGQAAPAGPLVEGSVSSRPESGSEQSARELSRRWKGKLRVAAIFKETADVRTIRLAAPEGGALPFTFDPGQFLTVSVDIVGTVVKRPYTIASSPTRGHYCELSVGRVESGTVSRHLCDRVAVGDELDISAASGRFVFKGTESDSIVLIGGGVGITPLMSVIRYLTDTGWMGEVILLLSIRTPRHYIFRRELEFLCRRHPNLRVVPTVTRKGARWSGLTGRIDRDLLESSISHLNDRRIHICGPGPMMTAIEALLGEMGVAPGQIMTESFGKANSTEHGTARGNRGREPAAPVSPTITFQSSDRSAPLPEDKTILDVADDLGIEIDNSCREGTCGTCVVRLVSGVVTMACEDGLDPKEKAAGMVLACQARSTTDVTVDA